MQREIKFRAWDKENKQMFSVWRITYDTGVFYQPFGVKKVLLKIGHEVNIDHIELMQFTGLHDRNGKEIYENDVIRYREGMYDDWHTGEIIYHGDRGYPAFDVVPTIDCDSNGLSYIMACCECEVIGNSYENSELLEGGKGF